MPLVRVEVRNEYGIGVPEMYREANREEPKEILEGVAVAGLVGLLRQLGDLSDFAAEVFHGLQEEFAMTSSRSRKLKGRIRRIEVAVSPFEKVALAQRSHLHFAHEPGCSWKYRRDCEKDMFVYTKAPQFIFDAYDNCREPPRLHLLDRFDPSGPGSCLKRYSDPFFFKEASLASGQASDRNDLEDKKGGKIKKLRSLRRNGGAPAGSLMSNHGGSIVLPCQTTSGHDAMLRSDLYERANFDLRNGSSYIKSGFKPSYSEEKECSELISSPMRNGGNCLERNALGANIEGSGSNDQIYTTQAQDQDASSSFNVPQKGKAVKSEMAIPGYDHHSLRQEEDHCVNAESISTKQDIQFEGEDKIDVQSCNQNLPESECVVVIDEFDTEKDIFMDAPNAIELEDDIDIPCTRKHDVDKGSKSMDKAAELIQQNFDSQSYSESNGLANSAPIIGGNGGCGHNPISMSLKSSFATFCCISSCISAKNGCDLVARTGGPYVNGGITGDRNAEHASPSVSSDIRTMSPESQKPASDTSDAASFSFWTNGVLLGLQPSIPHDCGTLKDLAQYDNRKLDKTKSFRNSEGGLNINSSRNDGFQESSWSFRKTLCKISPADLGIELGRSSVRENACFDRSSFIQAGSVLPVSANMHPENSRRLSLTSFQNANASEYQTLSEQMKDTLGHEPPISSPCSSPPLRHMKISFQPIDGYETSRLKLTFPCGITNGESCRDILPSFQLVPDPEVSIAQQNGGSDSDDDTFYQSSPSLLDGCHGHQSESESEQWESGESPANNDPDLCTSPGIEQYGQSSRSFDQQSLMALNYSFQEERNDTNSRNLVEPEFATTTPGPSHIPPVQWYSVKTNWDCSSNISQQPKPAPLNHDNTNVEQNRKSSNGEREADKGKSVDEDFLQLIRSKSLNLRPTGTTKPAVPSESPPSVHVSAILTKANSIRQAVGSDDAEEDGDGNWSDS